MGIARERERIVGDLQPEILTPARVSEKLLHAELLLHRGRLLGSEFVRSDLACGAHVDQRVQLPYARLIGPFLGIVHGVTASDFLRVALPEPLLCPAVELRRNTDAF